MFSAFYSQNIYVIIFKADTSRFDNSQVEVINAGNENLLNHKIEDTDLPDMPKQAFTRDTGGNRRKANVARPV